jgi:RNA polymerase subunit RPABC4/transcription elongation factor Spt4
MTDHPICPTCHGHIPNNDTPGAYPGALSRVDNKTEVCSACGVKEAIQAFAARVKHDGEVRA